MHIYIHTHLCIHLWRHLLHTNTYVCVPKLRCAGMPLHVHSCLEHGMSLEPRPAYARICESVMCSYMCMYRCMYVYLYIYMSVCVCACVSCT